MNSWRRDCRGISRREMFTGAALTFGTVVVLIVIPRQALAQKVSQPDIEYQASPKGFQRCADCLNFQAPKACKFVQGDISANGWCQLFTPKE